MNAAVTSSEADKRTNPSIGTTAAMQSAGWLVTGRLRSVTITVTVTVSLTQTSSVYGPCSDELAVTLDTLEGRAASYKDPLDRIATLHGCSTCRRAQVPATPTTKTLPPVKRVLPETDHIRSDYQL